MTLARDAFDADLMASIDNTTRKLMGETSRPLSVGFWLSLGHSSVFFIMVALLAFGIRSLAAQPGDDQSAVQTPHQFVGHLGLGHLPDPHQPDQTRPH